LGRGRRVDVEHRAVAGHLTGIALFFGIAFAAQLEARRVGVPEPTEPDQWKALEERTGSTYKSRT